MKTCFACRVYFLTLQYPEPLTMSIISNSILTYLSTRGTQSRAEALDRYQVPPPRPTPGSTPKDSWERKGELRRSTGSGREPFPIQLVQQGQQRQQSPRGEPPNIKSQGQNTGKHHLTGGTLSTVQVLSGIGSSTDSTHHVNTVKIPSGGVELTDGT